MPPGRRRAVKRGSAATASRRAGGVKRSAALKRRLLRAAQRRGCEGEVGCLEVDKTHVGTLHRLKMSPTHAKTCGAAASPPRPLSSLPARPPTRGRVPHPPRPSQPRGPLGPPARGARRFRANTAPWRRGATGPGPADSGGRFPRPVPAAAPAPSTGRSRCRPPFPQRPRRQVRGGSGCSAST